MADHSKIEWTEATWNPIRARLLADLAIRLENGQEKVLSAGTWGYHCERVSPGCKYCYACAMNGRTFPAWGTGLDYSIPNREEVEVFLDEEELLKPLRWKRPRMIFPCSMTDWCADFVTDEMRDRMLAVCALTPQHTYQFLTKRAAQQREYFRQNHISAEIVEFAGSQRRVFHAMVALFPHVDPHALNRASDFNERHYPCGDGFMRRWPLPNAWLGVSVENQQYADERIPHLLATPADVRWVSYEPALGPVDFRPWLDGEEEHGVDLSRPVGSRVGCCVGYRPPLDWVVAGGESGPGARPMYPDWARSVRDQCVAAGVPFFFKQFGEWAPKQCFASFAEWNKASAHALVMPDGSYTAVLGRDEPDEELGLTCADLDGNDYASAVARVGKKRAGRLLDGRTWDEMPVRGYR